MENSNNVWTTQKFVGKRKKVKSKHSKKKNTHMSNSNNRGGEGEVVAVGNVIGEICEQ